MKMVNDNRSRSLYVPLSEAVPPGQRVGRKEELKLILEQDMTKHNGTEGGSSRGVKSEQIWALAAHETQ